MNEQNSTRTIEELPTETAFALLADRQRRIAVRVLLEHDGAASLADVATLVAARQTDSDVEEVPEAAFERTRVRLHHQHLPKLADGGVIEYDDEKRIVEPENLAGIEPALEAAAERAS